MSQLDFMKEQSYCPDYIRGVCSRLVSVSTLKLPMISQKGASTTVSSSLASLKSKDGVARMELVFETSNGSAHP